MEKAEKGGKLTLDADNKYGGATKNDEQVVSIGVMKLFL